MDKGQNGLNKIPVLILGVEPKTAARMRDALGQAGANQITDYAKSAAFARSEKPVPANALVVLGSSDRVFCEILDAQSVSRHRVLHFFSREIVDSILALFPAGTSALDDTQVQQLPQALLQLWDAAIARQFEDELTSAHESGLLQLLALLTGTPEGRAQDRARLAFALGTEVFRDFDLLRRTIRLALFAELSEVPGWQSTMATAKNLWSISLLLEHRTKLAGDNPWPAQTEPELAVVEIANLALTMLADGLSERDFRAETKRRTTSLPFSLRTGLRIAAERILRSLWERRYDVA